MCLACSLGSHQLLCSGHYKPSEHLTLQLVQTMLQPPHAALQVMSCADPAWSAGAWDEPCLSEMRHQALLPLQRAMHMLTAGQESTGCDGAEAEMQLVAMRILANVSWVLERIDATG